jgi:hypothetical protein
VSSRCSNRKWFDWERKIFLLISLRHIFFHPSTRQFSPFSFFPTHEKENFLSDFVFSLSLTLLRYRTKNICKEISSPYLRVAANLAILINDPYHEEGKRSMKKSFSEVAKEYLLQISLHNFRNGFM